ncbi:TonB-dependent receptor [Pseudomaricurvus alkylphenolicus]|uniref:TonB-dependent receptor n=1 Tax=Pseudomaricurvus alkylphenolicus TaxID=1306991 RepID=UPI00141F714C|nr:TonB-dependent receptor [Pseudomaricurvus alkylphenolicus]NIB42490.1 TonB-dependent receptor [Pseudomaricurvus alkylphenolicus]
MKPNPTFSVRPAVLATAIATTILGQPAMAQEDDGFFLEEIVVTAQRKEQSLQEVPLSLTAVTGDMLAEQGIDGFEDYAARVPGFNLRGQSSVENSVTLRGISPMGGSAAPVAVYIDEMPISGIQGNGQPSIKSFDVNRVEILRGPQGTLYGEGSLGGTIKVIMNKPDVSEFSARIDGTASNTSDGGTNTAANVMVNLPLIEDTLAARAIFQYRDSDGFLDAPNLGKDDVNGEELGSGRVSLRWIASDNLTIDATAIYQDVDLDGRGTGFSEDVVITDPTVTIPGSYRERDTSISMDQTGTDRYEQYNLTVTYDSDNYQFVSATSYYDRDTRILRDLANLVPVVNSIALAGSGSGYNPFLTEDVAVTGVGNQRVASEEIFTQELRVSYVGGDKLEWQAGLFYKDRSNSISDIGTSDPDLNQYVRESVDLGAGGFFGSYEQNRDGLQIVEEQDFEQIAGFGEVTYKFTDKLTGNIGVRYFEEERESVSASGGYFIQANVFGTVMGMTGNPAAAIGAVNAMGLPIIAQDDATISETTWKLNLSYQLSNDHMVYGTISKGFRAGGVNSFSLANEGLTGLPIGSLPRSYDPDTLINYEIGAKTQWYNGRLTLNGALFLMDWEDVQVNWDPTGLGFPTVINAETAHSQGIEIEGVAHLSQSLEINFGATYIDAKLDDDVVFPDGTVAFEEGGNLGVIPNYTYTIGGSYRFDILEGLEGVARLNYNYTAETSKDPAEIETQKTDAYGLASASLSAISEEGWEVKLFVNNLTDEVAEVYYETRGEFNTIRPRTIGVNASMNF